MINYKIVLIKILLDLLAQNCDSISLRVLLRLWGLKRSRWNWFEIQALRSEVGCLNRGRRLSVSVAVAVPLPPQFSTPPPPPPPTHSSRFSTILPPSRQHSLFSTGNWPHKFTQKLTLTKVSTFAWLLGLKTGSIYASYYYCFFCRCSCCCCCCCFCTLYVLCLVVLVVVAALALNFAPRFLAFAADTFYLSASKFEVVPFAISNQVRNWQFSRVSLRFRVFVRVCLPVCLFVCLFVWLSHLLGKKYRISLANRVADQTKWTNSTKMVGCQIEIRS